MEPYMRHQASHYLTITFGKKRTKIDEFDQVILLQTKEVVLQVLVLQVVDMLYSRDNCAKLGIGGE